MGGNRLEYDGNFCTQSADLTTVKILMTVNHVISTADARFTTIEPLQLQSLVLFDVHDNGM